MSDEEKKAIEYWKKYMEILHWNTQLASEHYIKVLLDLIEKQSKEIEYQKLKGKNQILELEMNIEEYIKALTEWVNGERVSIHCVHKDKIKAKIEEIEEEKRHYLEINDEYNAQICDCIIEEYKSLLEKE